MRHSDIDAPRGGRRIAIGTAALVVCLWPAVARADHLPRPTLSGEAQVGQVMRADIPGGPPESWVWYRCRAGHVRGECPRISGATEQTYRIAPADEGHILRASAYDEGHDSRWSAVPSAVIRPVATPVNTSPPALTSTGTPTARPASAVTWALGTWTGTSALTLAVERCRPDVSGCQAVFTGTVAYATGLGFTYSVRPDDLGHVLVLAVQAADVDASRVRTAPTPVVIGEPATTPPSGSPPPPVVTPPSGATPSPAVPAPPPPPTPVPTKPSPAGVVAALRARLDVNVVRLTWRAPKGATVVVVRRVGARPRHAADGKVVYRGTARATRDTPRAARRVWYGVFLIDAAGPSAGSGTPRPVYASLPRVTPRLLAPLQGVRTGRTVRFLWRPVATARYYNVQIWDDRVTRRIVSRWPTQRSLTLRLRPGRYRWYVYPGYGAPTSVRYGALIGQGSFRVG